MCTLGSCMCFFPFPIDSLEHWSIVRLVYYGLCLGSCLSHQTRLLVFPVSLISWLRGCSEFSGKCLASGLDVLSLSKSGENDDTYDKVDKAMSGNEEREEAPLDSLLASTAEPGEEGRSRGHKASSFFAIRRVESIIPLYASAQHWSIRYLPVLAVADALNSH